MESMGAESFPEADLIARAKTGDSSAFDRLAARHRRQLGAHCYRMLGSPHDADDALQESLIAAWKGLPSFEGRSSLKTWLYQVTTNVCLRMIAKRPRRAMSPEVAPPLADASELGQPVWNSPLAANLVDELHLMGGNVLFGGGEPALAGVAPRKLALIGERRWEGSQNVLLQYVCEVSA